MTARDSGYKVPCGTRFTYYQGLVGPLTSFCSKSHLCVACGEIVSLRADLADERRRAELSRGRCEPKWAEAVRALAVHLERPASAGTDGSKRLRGERIVVHEFETLAEADLFHDIGDAVERGEVDFVRAVSMHSFEHDEDMDEGAPCWRAVVFSTEPTHPADPELPVDVVG